MNNPLVDEIQRLSDCRSHAERADWLLTVPLSVLSHYEMTIRNRLQIAGFHAGVVYLEQELRVFRCPRQAGLLAYGAAWAEAKIPVIDAAAAAYMLAAEAPPAPDPSITDL